MSSFRLNYYLSLIWCLPSRDALVWLKPLNGLRHLTPNLTHLSLAGIPHICPQKVACSIQLFHHCSQGLPRTKAPEATPPTKKRASAGVACGALQNLWVVSWPEPERRQTLGPGNERLTNFIQLDWWLGANQSKPIQNHQWGGQLHVSGP